MKDETPPSEMILYQTEDGRTRVQCRFENESIWLTQIQLAELFQMTVPNISQHLKSIYGEGELAEEATVKSYLMVRTEGTRVTSDLHVAANVVHQPRIQVAQHLDRRGVFGTLIDPCSNLHPGGIQQSAGGDDISDAGLC